VFRRLQELDIKPALVTGPASPSAQQSDAVERVIRRAQELRASWQGAP
jgi:hypothetical protein